MANKLIETNRSSGVWYTIGTIDEQSYVGVVFNDGYVLVYEGIVPNMIDSVIVY